MNAIDEINEIFKHITRDLETARAGACTSVPVPVPVPAPASKEVSRIWLRLTTSRHHTVKGILVEAGKPDLTGYTKIDEGGVNANAFLNNGVVALAFFRQAEGKAVGKGDIWALVDFPT